MRRLACLPLVMVVGLGLAVLACRRGDAPKPDATKTEIRQFEADRPGKTAYLDGALLNARYDSTALAELGRGLPRPTPTGSPLVAVFSGVVEQLLGEPSDRLAAVGVRPNAAIELSVRALDGRAASARKLLGELTTDNQPNPALLERLRSEAGTLGLHMRASLPMSDRASLLPTLTQIVAGPGEWAPTCAALADTSLCTGRERLLVWARPTGDRLVVDAIYLFHAGADPSELEWIAKRADAWASGEALPDSEHDFELELRAAPTLRLLEAEALADAVQRFDRGALDYHGYLDQEQALRDLVPSERVFDGLRVDVDIDDGVSVETRWLPAARPPVAIAELFAPLRDPVDLPILDDACRSAPVCARLAGLTITPRFAPLASGPFADTTGMTRVLRQAGERGSILLLLGSWPNLLGTAGRMAEAERGIMGEAQAALVEEAHAIGGVMLTLASDARDDAWVGYLRLGPKALAALRPLAMVAGIGPRPIDLPGVEGLVDRGRYESDDQATWVYLVEQSPGGWLLAADGDASASWLLTHPREDAAGLSAIGYLQIRELGPLAAREDVAFADDAPVRSWLNLQRLELELRFSAEGPIVQLRIKPAG